MSHLILVSIYFFLMPVLFIFIWGRYFYLTYKFNAYMFNSHKNEWMDIYKQTEDWFGMESLFKFNSKAVYNFIWRSNECLGDNNISKQRRSIRSIIWQLPLFFAIVIAVSLLFIFMGFM